MGRNTNPPCNLSRWNKTLKETVKNLPIAQRRGNIATNLNWLDGMRTRVGYDRARVVMEYLQEQWPDVQPLQLIHGGNHQEVYDRVYDWCVHELLPPPPPRRFYRCAVARAQALARRYKHRHSLNGHLKYSCGGFIFGAYEKRRKPNSYCYSCYAELEFRRSSRPI